MVRKLNYCKGIIIAHGKSELLLAEHIKSNLHLPIEIYALKNGKMSIQIDSLMNVLGNNVFKNKREFKKNYIVEEEKREFKNFFVMPIMDLDDTTEEKIEKFREENNVRGMGSCHIIWRKKKEILKNDYNIDWMSPGELNTDIMFD